MRKGSDPEPTADARLDCELTYAGKKPEDQILAQAAAVLEKAAAFGEPTSGGGWANVLVFGDNLPVLKALLAMKHEGRLASTDGTPGAGLVYIDPPYATGHEFHGRRGKAYDDTLHGAPFLEFPRERLVFLWR